MGKIAAFNNSKGGIGKTSMTFGSAQYLAGIGKRVLAIDGDGQHNLTRAMVTEDLLATANGKTIYSAIKEVSKGASKVSLPIVHVKENLDLVPGSIEKARADLDLARCRIPLGVLAMLLAPYRDKYDYILIDCAPGLGLFSMNVFVAADFIFLPALLEDESYYGAVELLGFLRSEISQHNPALKFGGIIINKYNLFERICKDVYSNLQKTFKGHVLHSRLRKNNVVALAQRNHVSFAEIDRKSNAAIDIESLAKEIMEIMGDSGPNSGTCPSKVTLRAGESIVIANGKITVKKS